MLRSCRDGRRVYSLSTAFRRWSALAWKKKWVFIKRTLSRLHSHISHLCTQHYQSGMLMLPLMNFPNNNMGVSEPCKASHKRAVEELFVRMYNAHCLKHSLRLSNAHTLHRDQFAMHRCNLSFNSLHSQLYF